MEIKIYQVDAFTDRTFSGNPAAVCPLDKWLPDEILQHIAMENNLAETAFYVNEPSGLHIRWFTPAAEVDLCGHATLASAFILFEEEGYRGQAITFNSRSGPLKVTRNLSKMILDFPTDTLTEVSISPELAASFDIMPQQALRGKTDFMLVFEDESQIRAVHPNPMALGRVPARGVIVTAQGDEVDFVSRFFAPRVGGVDEDSVTGSAHTSLIPYWSGRLGKMDMEAYQCSARGGSLSCGMRGDRVEIGGRATLFMKGTLFID